MNINTNDNPIALSFLLNEDLYFIQEKNEFAGFEYFGENNRFVLVLHVDETVKFINQEEKEFLMRMLAALKLTEQSIALVNLAHYKGTNLKQLKDFFACNKVLAFGIEPSGLQLSNTVMYALTDYDAQQLIFADALADLKNDDQKKRTLWMELKKMFNV